MSGDLSADLQAVVMGLLQDFDAQASAVAQLGNLVDSTEGLKAQAVGAAIRDFGGVQPLLDLLAHERTQQDALRVLGNLASNEVDAAAEETKALLHELGAFPRVLPLVHAPSETTQVYALGAVQNMCTRPEYARHVRATGADVRVRQLAEASPNSTVRRFAAGCLANMRAVLEPGFVPASPQQSPASPAGQRARWGGGGGEHEGGGSSSAALVRHRVAADHSCLFTSCAYLCHPLGLGLEEGERLAIAAFELRSVCVERVREHAAEVLPLLGFDDAAAYAEWILDATHWGGEPELSLLAEHFGVEIVVATWRLGAAHAMLGSQRMQCSVHHSRPAMLHCVCMLQVRLEHAAALRRRRGAQAGLPALHGAALRPARRPRAALRARLPARARLGPAGRGARGRRAAHRQAAQRGGPEARARAQPARRHRRRTVARGGEAESRRHVIARGGCFP